MANRSNLTNRLMGRIHSRRIGGREAIMGSGVDEAARSIGASAFTDKEGTIYMRSGMDSRTEEAKMAHEAHHADHHTGQAVDNDDHHAHEQAAQAVEMAFHHSKATHGNDDLGEVLAEHGDPDNQLEASKMLNAATNGAQETDDPMVAYQNLIAQKYSHGIIVETLTRRIADQREYNAKMNLERSDGKMG